MGSGLVQRQGRVVQHPGGNVTEPYKPAELPGAAISADGSAVAWYGGQISEQARTLGAEHLIKQYAEPLWRRIAGGAGEPTRRVTGGSDPESPGCLAKPEPQLPPSPQPGDACQGPFDVQRTGVGTWNGGNGADYVPRLSADGDYVAFLAAAPLVTEGEAFGLSEFNSDVYRENMTAPDRTSGLRRLTQYASADIAHDPTNANIRDLGISPDGEQIAFTTRRTVFPLGAPAFVSPLAAAPGLVELYDADLGSETLTRVTRGYEGGPPEHPEIESGNEDRYSRAADGSLSPSFSAGGTLLSFSSTASNLVFGDGNSPPNAQLNKVDGADVFLVPRIVFDYEPTPQVISPAPANPGLEVPWRLELSATSLASGAVQLKARVPGAGVLAASAASTVPAKSARARGGSRRTVAHASTSARDAAEIVALKLQLGGRYRALAFRAGGLVEQGHRDLLVQGPSDASQDADDPLRAPREPRQGRKQAAPMRRQATVALLLALALLAVAALLAPGAGASPLADEGGAEWQVEQPLPPAPPGAGTSEGPVSLGHIGDIEFYEPNRGALITSGNGGSVKPGVWFYDGAKWVELAEQCGATDGRIAWVGPDEFWTVSDGRPGQAVASSSERPPLADNTLCHFAPGPSGSLEIVGSYGSVPFLGTSYQAMHAAGCLSAFDCWFGGDPLPEPQIGAFMLNWNGAGLAPQPFLPEGRPVRDMVSFEGRLYESMRIGKDDRVAVKEERPPPLRSIKAGVSGEESPFESVQPENQLQGHLLYANSEFSTALDYLRLSVAGGALWAAAGAQVPGPPKNSSPAGVTILRKPENGEWQTVIGPQPEETGEHPPGQIAFPKDVAELDRRRARDLERVGGARRRRRRALAEPPCAGLARPGERDRRSLGQD